MSKELIERLRHIYADGDPITEEAADLIDRQAKQIEALENQLALDIQSCHANCSKSPRVNRRLREQLAIAREAMKEAARWCDGGCHARFLLNEALAKLKEE